MNKWPSRETKQALGIFRFADIITDQSTMINTNEERGTRMKKRKVKRVYRSNDQIGSLTKLNVYKALETTTFIT